MEYKCKETPLALKYQSIYLEARRKKQELLCLIGTDKNYRIVTKGSYYDNISDMDTVLELCIYPLYIKGNTEIKDELQELIKQMTSSDDVLQIFQVFNLIMSQEIESTTYSNIPFEINVLEIIDTLLNKKSALEEKIKNYKENGFERFGGEIWRNIENICENSVTIQTYMASKN